MLHFGRKDDEPTQAATMAATQTLVRVYSPGTLRAYSASELRHLRGPSAHMGEAAAAPSAFDVTPAGAGDLFEVTSRDLGRAMRREGNHYVEVSFWDTASATLRLTFEQG